MQNSEKYQKKLKYQKRKISENSEKAPFLSLVCEHSYCKNYLFYCIVKFT